MLPVFPGEAQIMDAVYTNLFFSVQKEYMYFTRTLEQSDFYLSPLLKVHVPITTSDRKRVKTVRQRPLKSYHREIIWSTTLAGKIT